MTTTNTKSKKAAAGQNSGYIITNGIESYPAGNDRSNARRKAKAMTAKNPTSPAFEVKPVNSSAPTMATLQAAVVKAEGAIKGGGKAKAKASKPGPTQKAATDLGVIAKEGKKLALKRKSSGAIYAMRANKPGAVEKLLYQAKMVGLKVENAKEAAALVAAKPEAK